MTANQFVTTLANIKVAIKSKIDDKFPTNKIKTASSTGMNEAVSKLLDDLVTQVTSLAGNVFFTSSTSDDITEGTVNKFLNTTNLNILLSASETTTDNLTEGNTNQYYTEAKVTTVIDTLRPTQAATAVPTGGTVIDIEARATISDLITKLQAANIIA